VLSVAMMLDFLGYPELAAKVEGAVAADAAASVAGKQSGATRTTAEVGDALAARIRA
jgi:3-isopropylmalate dehydrogenase